MTSQTAIQPTASADSQVPTTADVPPTIRVYPSRFNARTVATDGTLVLYNSLSGAFSGVPAHAREQAEALLCREGRSVQKTGLAKYMLDRGFLVCNPAIELDRFRWMHGIQHYRPDKMILTLLASEECNFRCVYCAETFPRGTMEPWVRQAVVAMVERRIKQLRHFDLSWFGGEPLLGLEAIRDICPRIQDLARENGVEFRSGMTTNGFLLTKEVLAEVFGYGVSYFQISLDGSAREHDCKRGLKGGGGSFQTIYENLKAARDLTERFTIALRINFDKDNVPRMQELFDMLKQDFAHDTRYKIYFHPVGAWGGPNDKKLNLCGCDDEYSNKLDLQKTAHALGLNLESRLPWLQGPAGAAVCKSARPFSLLVGADGRLMKCCLAMSGQDYNLIGQLKPDGTAEIDTDKHLRWIDHNFENDETCKQCFFLPACQGGRCPHVRVSKPGARACLAEKVNIAATLNSLWELRSVAANQYRVGPTGDPVQVQSGGTTLDAPTASAD